MTTTKENNPTSHTVLSNSPGYCNKLIAWGRKNPKKAAVVLIVVVAITFIWIHGPFYRTSDVMEGIPMILGDHGSGVNRLK